MIVPRPTTPAGTFALARDVRTGECQALEVVPHAAADPSHGRISMHSPFGRAVAAARLGTTCRVDTLHGPRHLQLISVDRQFDW
jgi:transcription elongation GreA/GreB family factor